MNQHYRVLSGNVCDQRAQDRSKCRFSERAKSQAGECNSHLNAGDHAVQLADQFQNDLRPNSPLIHQLPHARMPYCNQRKLDRREKSIHGHESEQSEESQPDQINKVLRRLILAASAPRPKGHCMRSDTQERLFQPVQDPWRFIKRLFRFSRVH